MAGRDFLDDAVWLPAPHSPSSELPDPLCKKYIKFSELCLTSTPHDTLYVFICNAKMITRVCLHITRLPPCHGHVLSHFYTTVFALQFYMCYHYRNGTKYDMREYTHLRGAFLLGFTVLDVDGCGEAVGPGAFFLPMDLFALFALCLANRRAGGEECERAVFPSVLLR